MKRFRFLLIAVLCLRALAGASGDITLKIVTAAGASSQQVSAGQTVGLSTAIPLEKGFSRWMVTHGDAGLSNFAVVNSNAFVRSADAAGLVQIEAVYADP